MPLITTKALEHPLQLILGDPPPRTEVDTERRRGVLERGFGFTGVRHCPTPIRRRNTSASHAPLPDAAEVIGDLLTLAFALELPARLVPLLLGRSEVGRIGRYCPRRRCRRRLRSMITSMCSMITIDRRSSLDGWVQRMLDRSGNFTARGIEPANTHQLADLLGLPAARAAASSLVSPGSIQTEPIGASAVGIQDDLS